MNCFYLLNSCTLSSVLAAVCQARHSRTTLLLFAPNAHGLGYRPPVTKHGKSGIKTRLQTRPHPGKVGAFARYARQLKWRAD
ncbi:MAG: hypothetical protein RugAbin2_00553 [Rugosibacter sp.]|nr:hypothetical protein [Rugosibacter sp.]